MKRVFDSIHEIESYFNTSVDKNFDDETLYVCYFAEELDRIFHQHRLNCDDDTLERALKFDDNNGYENDYVYVKVNHHLHTEIGREEFTNKLLGCEFVRSDFILPYRQFIHAASWLNGELIILDQEKRPSVFRTCRFYVDNETLVDSVEFEKFIKGE